MGEEFFDGDFHQISPVKKHVFDESYTLNDSTTLSSGGMQAIQNSIGSRATFVSSLPRMEDYPLGQYP